MMLKRMCNECCVRSHHNEKNREKPKYCDSVDVMTGNYNDGVCEGNAYTKDNWEKRCCGKHCKLNGCFEDSHFPNSLWYVSICIIAVQFNGTTRVCPHKQEVSQSGLSSASYDSGHDIESVEHQVAVQQ